MADPASSDGNPSPKKPSTVYITMDLGPSADAEPRDGTAQKNSNEAPRSPEPHREPLLWEPPDPADLARVLPGYHVLELIGSGGMGAVYRAKQKSLERLVALKVLSPELAERAPEFTERFNNEAGALAKLSHPSIVHLFDCGRTKDGQLYIAMELVEGRDVGDMLAGKQPLREAEALSIATGVCVALDHAHQRGVIHRDIKPANVMLDAADRVKITDFGLARIIQTAVPKERQTTSLLGTPRFTAPEALVPGAEVDGRADIFSLGVMLYQMLTGEVPRGTAAPPSELMPGLDRRLDAIVARAMAESPRDRYPDAHAVLEALEALRRAQVAETLPATTFFTREKETPKPPAPVIQQAPPPAYLEQRDYYEDSYEEPQRSSSMMPWVSTLIVVAIAGYWGWQQYRHQNDPIQDIAPPAQRVATAPPTASSRTAPPANTPPSDGVAAAPAPAGTATEDPSSAFASPSVPASSAPMPAPPKPLPKPSPPPPAPVIDAKELAETQRRIAQIQGDFDTSAKEWQEGQDAKFNQLDAQYLRAVRTDIVTMRNERRLEDLAGLQEEERLLATRTPLPPLDAAAPLARVRLRGIYDAQVLQIAVAGAETKVELYNRMLGSLFAYQSILKQKNQSGSAGIVAGVMDRVVAERDDLRASLKDAPAQ